MLKSFRAISVLEGLSFITLLFVTYVLGNRDYLFLLGMTHGLLFMLYVVMAMVVSHKETWSLPFFLLVFFAAVIPFAFVGLEFHFRKHEEGNAEPPSA